MDDCTHGADCTIHPNAHGLHNYDPTAEDALRKVWDEFVSPRMPDDFTAADTKVACAAVERVAKEMGITL